LVSSAKDAFAAGQRHGHCRPPVEAACKRDYVRSPRRHLSQLDRAFDRFGATIGKEVLQGF
jgi:hypothetical protein